MFKYIPVQETVTVVLIFGVIDFFLMKCYIFRFKEWKKNVIGLEIWLVALSTRNKTELSQMQILFR